MARHLKSKIDVASLQLRRKFTSKPDVKISSSRSGSADEVDMHNENETHLRYNPCQKKAPSVFKLSHRKHCFEAGSKSSPEMHHFPQSSIRCNRSGEEEMENRIYPAQSMDDGKRYRNFMTSTTYKNVTLPLKSSKLANPFPEPVKVMPSHTVSDQEKADQMLAESRVPMFPKK